MTMTDVIRMIEREDGRVVARCPVSDPVLIRAELPNAEIAQDIYWRVIREDFDAAVRSNRLTVTAD